ncbi:MAG TPA: phosphotransferase [Gaiellaceae bacterium]|nr:phosphotransferase [Gaiellaceae bacterium]
MCAAFGAVDEPVPLAGGQGSAWLAGEFVLKPLDFSEAELAWQADVLSNLACDDFRVARPLRTRDGSLTAGGWCAWTRVDGEHEERRWPDIVSVGERFHQALEGVPCPAFIGLRRDRWSIGDRVAWGELPVGDFAHVKHVPRLAAQRRPVDEPSQLIHGDLTGNVLFADPLPPAVIDFSPYWRPTGYASAIVVGDALVWEGADRSILDGVRHVREFAQLLLRALIMRAVVDRLFRAHEPIRPDDADPYLPAVDLACELAESSS